MCFEIAIHSPQGTRRCVLAIAQGRQTRLLTADKDGGPGFCWAVLPGRLSIIVQFELLISDPA